MVEFSSQYMLLSPGYEHRTSSMANLSRSSSLPSQRQSEFCKFFFSKGQISFLQTRKKLTSGYSKQKRNDVKTCHGWPNLFAIFKLNYRTDLSCLPHVFSSAPLNKAYLMYKLYWTICFNPIHRVTLNIWRFIYKAACT